MNTLLNTGSINEPRAQARIRRKGKGTLFQSFVHNFFSLDIIVQQIVSPFYLYIFKDIDTPFFNTTRSDWRPGCVWSSIHDIWQAWWRNRSKYFYFVLFLFTISFIHSFIYVLLHNIISIPLILSLQISWPKNKRNNQYLFSLFLMLFFFLIYNSTKQQIVYNTSRRIFFLFIPFHSFLSMQSISLLLYYFFTSNKPTPLFIFSPSHLTHTHTLSHLYSFSYHFFPLPSPSLSPPSPPFSLPTLSPHLPLSTPSSHLSLHTPTHPVPGGALRAPARTHPHLEGGWVVGDGYMHRDTESERERERERET